MGILEEQARFLTAKYGTAAGPTGITQAAPVGVDLATVMVVLGVLILAAIAFTMLRDWQSPQRHEHL